MILVDIHVPSMDRTYDFELDEDMTTKKATEKIVRIIAQKEYAEHEEEEKMFLFSMGRGSLLNSDFTLKEQGIKSGERLILL